MASNSLILFDKNGVVSMASSGYEEEPSMLFVEVPDGKYVDRIDVSGDTPTPVFADEPTNYIKELQDQIDDLTDCILEMSETVYGE